MTLPRLMRVEITTPRSIRGPDVSELLSIKIQQRLNLDAPVQYMFLNAHTVVEHAETFTSVTFVYSNGFADSAAFNGGVADVEGEILEAVKRAFEVQEVFFCTVKRDWKRG